MQVSVESTGSLERKITVQVPAEKVEEAVNSRLQNLSRTVRLDGFRPGKVPLKVIKQKFSGSVRNEVASELLQSTLHDALVQEKLNPAEGPKIDSLKMEPGQDMEYSAIFEVYPQIELKSLEGKSIERPVCEITDGDLDKMFEKLQAQRTTWDPVEREAAEGDQVIIDFNGTIGGEEFSGGKASNVPLVLGSGTMIPGFEDQLIGVKAGETRNINVSFPKDYQGKDVAGKDAVFEIKVSSVSEAKLPEINDEFAKGFGVEGGIEAFRKEVRENMERELSQAVRSKVKNAVMDALLEANEIDLPKALVEEEIDRSIQQMTQQKPEALKNLNLPREMFEEQARKRVALGLLVAEVIKVNKVEIDQQRIKDKLNEIASTYEKPEEVIKAYSENRQLMQSLEALAIEEQVVDLLLKQLNIQDKNMSFDEIMNPESGN